MSTTTTDESIGWWWCRAMESECATKTRHTVPQAVVGNQLSKAARSGRPRRWIEIDVPSHTRFFLSALALSMLIFNDTYL
uniref:Uncharacterized protein n=1 Tax=Panagrellus redivivus TaxID=6233 RepID=A0A7E4WBX8_PANRE